MEVRHYHHFITNNLSRKLERNVVLITKGVTLISEVVQHVQNSRDRPASELWVHWLRLLHLCQVSHLTNDAHCISRPKSNHMTITRK